MVSSCMLPPPRRRSSRRGLALPALLLAATTLPASAATGSAAPALPAADAEAKHEIWVDGVEVQRPGRQSAGTSAVNASGHDRGIADLRRAALKIVHTLPNETQEPRPESQEQEQAEEPRHTTLTTVDQKNWRLLWLCPMPKPLPKIFKVSRGKWSFWDRHRIMETNTEFGAVVRTLLSFSREFRLKDGAGDLWGVVHRPLFSNDLVFSDCIGDELVRFVGDGSWFNSPTYTVKDPTGKILGKAAISPELSSDTQTFIFLKNDKKRAVAQLIQEKSWSSVETAVHTLVDPNTLGGSANPHVSPIDPLVDMRVLSLYSAIGFGSGCFYVWGLWIDVLSVVVPLVALTFAVRKYVRGNDRDSFRELPGSDQSMDALLEKREQVMQKVKQIEDELAKKARSNILNMLTMRCCSAGERERGRARPPAHQMAMCDPWHCSNDNELVYE